MEADLGDKAGCYTCLQKRAGVSTGPLPQSGVIYFHVAVRLVRLSRGSPRMLQGRETIPAKKGESRVRLQ